MNPLKSKRSPTSQNAKRTSGSWKIGPNVGEDFFNTIDPKRTFKAPHNPTTEVLGSFSHKRSPCRDRGYGCDGLGSAVKRSDRYVAEYKARRDCSSLTNKGGWRNDFHERRYRPPLKVFW